jgi:hypothetical protein
MASLRAIPLFFAASFLFCASTLTSQEVAPVTRIVDRVDDGQLVALRGNTHPAARARNDRGSVSPNLPMADLILVLSRDAAQQAAFERFVASQYDAKSPDFHQWLTPEQVGEKFGPSQTDIATISNWLTGRGFTISQVTKDRMSIRFSGTAGQVQSAFHTGIHNLEVKGVAHIANMSDPQIPAALATVVVGVKALHNFSPRPLHRMGKLAQRDGKTGKWQRTAIAAVPGAAASSGLAASRSLRGGGAKLQPQFGISVGGSYPYLVEDVDPWDFATIYNILPLWNATTPIDGTGQTIAIAGTSDINPTDVATFRTFFGLPAGPTPQQLHGAAGDPGICTSTSSNVACSIDDLIENSLDVEWSGSIAKNAQIVLVSTAYNNQTSPTNDPIYDSSSYVIDNLTARILNVSYGMCELEEGTAGNVSYYNLWQTAAAEGIAVFVAAGDSGSASCDAGDYFAESGLTVSGLASTPWNTAVGGTDFNWCPAQDFFNSPNTECTASPYWGAAYKTTGATTAVTTALRYVPETPWNNTCTNPLALTWMQDMAHEIYNIPVSDIASSEQGCNFIADYYSSLGNQYEYGQELLQVVGGSGGPSNCVANSSTETTTGTCTSNATTTGTTTNPNTSTNSSQSALPLVNNGWPKPGWQAGVSGIPNDGVRDLPDVSFFASNGYLSSSAYLICVSEDSSGYGSSTPCSYSTDQEPFAQEVGGTSVATPAMAGVMALINQSAGAAQGNPNAELYTLAAAQTYSKCSAETVTTSSDCLFNDIDTGTNAMPCDDGAEEAVSPDCTATQETLGNKDYGEGFGILNGYSATAGYDMATGLGSLNVANVVKAWPATVGSATAAVTVTPAVTSLFPNNILSVTVTVAGSGATPPQTPTGTTVTPTGTVTLTASGSSYTASSESYTGSYTFTIPADTLAAGTSPSIQANYAGDVVYGAASNSTTVQVNAGEAPSPTVTVTPASQTLNSNATLGVTVTVNSPTPTGTVTLSSGSYSGAMTTTGNGTYTITIPAGSLSGSSTGEIDVLTATYSGDGTDGSGTGQAPVTVTAATFTLTPSTTTPVSPGASTGETVTVASVGGYAGTVTLTCSLSSTTAAGGGDGASCALASGSSAGVTLTSTKTSGTVSFTVSTTAPVTAKMDYPNGGWLGAGGGAVLAFLLFLGVPARRRSWRQMVGMMVLMAAFGAMTACGSGGGSGGGGGGGQSDPGTLAGTYTFTVQATGNPSVTPTVSTTFAVTVN